MKAFNQKWTSIEAIKALFFVDNDARSNAIESATRACFGVIDNLQASKCKEPNIEEMASQAVNAFKVIWPSITTNSQLLPLLWLRLALHSESPPVTKEFLLGLASWRAKLKPGSFLIVKYKNKVTGKWRGKVHALIDSERIIGYTIDQILSQKEFDITDDGNEYDREWKFKKLRIEIPRSVGTKPKRLEDICGTAALRLLNAAIQREKELGASGLLYEEAGDNKLRSLSNRDTLLKKLKESDEKLSEYSNHSLYFGLAKLVKFQRGRPQKNQSIN